MLQKWIPEIQNQDEASKLSKQGAIAVLIFALMNLIGVLVVVFGNTSPVDGHGVTQEEIQNNIVGTAILLPVLLIFSWRIYKGKGWLIGGLTLVWFITEIAFKVVGGTTNVGWVIAYIAMCAMLINGIRACWWLRTFKAVVAETNDQNNTLG